MKNIWLQKRKEKLAQIVFRIPDVIHLPKVDKVLPPLCAEKIVNVQPLLGPVGLIYYLRFKYVN